MRVTLETSFAGLKLKNPLIVSSSSLTDTPAKNRKLYEAGAGAIVLKSLFEEQILMDADNLLDTGTWYGEGNDYLEGYLRQHKLNEYVSLIAESKNICDIPIIASINCYDDANWTDFARNVEKAGADALEINILALRTSLDYDYGEFEQKHIDILRRIKKAVRIPIIMKLGDNFTNPVALINQLSANGVAAVVLFNRFYPIDINVDRMQQVPGKALNTEMDLGRVLRWIGIASAAVKKTDYAASGGIHSAKGVIKTILAGATAVEICSTIYKNTSNVIAEYLQEMKCWMESKRMANIDSFKGLLSMRDLNGVNTFERTQFLKYFENFSQ